MNLRLGWVLAGGVACVVAQGACAASEPDVRPVAPGLLVDRRIQAELETAPEQARSLERILKGCVSEGMGGQFGCRGFGDSKQDALWRAALTELSARQRSRLQQLLTQLVPLAVLNDPESAPLFGLSEDQSSQIAALARVTAAERSSMMEDLSRRRFRSEKDLKSFVMRFEQSIEERIRALLTPRQKEILEKERGPEFRFAADR